MAAIYTARFVRAPDFDDRDAAGWQMDSDFFLPKLGCRKIDWVNSFLENDFSRKQALSLGVHTLHQIRAVTVWQVSWRRLSKRL